MSLRASIDFNLSHVAHRLKVLDGSVEDAKLTAPMTFLHQSREAEGVSVLLLSLCRSYLGCALPTLETKNRVRSLSKPFLVGVVIWLNKARLLSGLRRMNVATVSSFIRPISFRFGLFIRRWEKKNDG
jgi:hypothetical protein